MHVDNTQIIERTENKKKRTPPLFFCSIVLHLIDQQMHKMQNGVNPQFRCFQKPIQKKEHNKQVKVFNLKMGRKLKSPDTFFCKNKNLNKTSETVSCLFSYLIMKVQIYRLLTARCTDFIYWLYHAKTW